VASTNEEEFNLEAAFNEGDSLLNSKAVQHVVNQNSWYELLNKYMEISIPIILSELCLSSFDQISLLFVGNIGDTKLIAAVGLGNIIMFLFCSSLS